MALLQNNFMFTMGVYKFHGATLSNGAAPSSLQEAMHRTGAMRNFSVSKGFTNNQMGYPYGHLHPQSWCLPQKAGGLSSYRGLTGDGDASAPILAVKLAEAGLTGSGDLVAIGSLIVQLLADLVGSGEVSSAEVQAFLQLAADIGGSGEVSDAQLTGLGALVAALLGDGTAAESVLTGNGAIAANLVVTGTGLTTSNVGQAVWSALAAANNSAGTMGGKLNDAGSAGNPWAALLADNVDPDTFGALINDFIDARISEVKAKTDGLTYSVAGKVDANIKYVNDVEVGGTGSEADPWNPA